jgi:hydrophobic/amphiphilic exporter-1 (mainly G- bacteria), HAE1 family
VDDADRRFLLRSPGQFTSIDDVRNLIIMTRVGVPVYLKDIANVSDATEDRRQVTRINGRPGIPCG